jgi:L-serine dehydratase
MYRTMRIRRREGLTAWAIASNEIESRHRVDLDATITAMAETAKDMNSKYKETSQAGLALSVTLC